jgi:hypothetical protein
MKDLWSQWLLIQYLEVARLGRGNQPLGKVDPKQLLKKVAQKF